jgi:aryl-alcohol dehydrogenase-like predicted oxidoreductase
MEASIAGLETAYELGARLFDTADVYGHGRSERILGELVRVVDRKSLVLTSKVGYFAGTASHGFEPRQMRRQLEQTLDNLGTTYLDIYFFHHSNFGEDQSLLEPSAEAMRSFQAEGLVRAVGMRGPHRYASERSTTVPGRRSDKFSQFKKAFEEINPDILAVRDNALTPQTHTEGVYSIAREHQLGVLINKPLGQGLLTGTYSAARMREFGPGDHRLRKRWFTAPAIRIIEEGLEELRGRGAASNCAIVNLMLWACLDRYECAAVLAGFTSRDQVEMNLRCLDEKPSHEMLALTREIMSQVQVRLNESGEVFLDEPRQR